jgi:hypothetical protein
MEAGEHLCAGTGGTHPRRPAPSATGPGLRRVIQQQRLSSRVTADPQVLTIPPPSPPSSWPELMTDPRGSQYGAKKWFSLRLPVLRRLPVARTAQADEHRSRGPVVVRSCTAGGCRRCECSTTVVTARCGRVVDRQGHGLLQRHVARPATFACSRESESVIASSTCATGSRARPAKTAITVDPDINRRPATTSKARDQPWVSGPLRSSAARIWLSHSVPSRRPFGSWSPRSQRHVVIIASTRIRHSRSKP